MKYGDISNDVSDDIMEWAVTCVAVIGESQLQSETKVQPFGLSRWSQRKTNRESDPESLCVVYSVVYLLTYLLVCRTRRTFPMQIDGEPWMQSPSTVSLVPSYYYYFIIIIKNDSLVTFCCFGSFINRPLTKVADLRAGDVLQFVCLFVWHLRNFWSHSLRGSTWQWTGAYRIDSDMLILFITLPYSKCLVPGLQQTGPAWQYKCQR